MCTEPQRVVRVTPGWYEVMKKVEWVKCKNSMSSASQQIVTSVGVVAGRKPRAVDRLRKASRRSRTAAEVNLHHAGDARWGWSDVVERLSKQKH